MLLVVPIEPGHTPTLNISEAVTEQTCGGKGESVVVANMQLQKYSPVSSTGTTYVLLPSLNTHAGDSLLSH